VSDHPVLIPTALGAVEGTVSEPDGGRDAALIFMQGGGAGLRSGLNSVWARMARELADCGVLVLRAEYWRREASTSSMIRGGTGAAGVPWTREVSLRREIVEWFRQRSGCRDLWLAGTCYGARLAIDIAARDPAVTRMLLIAPYLGGSDERPRWRLHLRALNGASVSTRIDRRAARDLRTVLGRMPVSMVFGEHDRFDALALERSLGTAGTAVDLDVVPGIAVYPVHSPEAQVAVLERTMRWARADDRVRAAALT
jgi:dienelactone hydrolase